MATKTKTLIATPYRRPVEDDEDAEQDDPNTQTEDEKAQPATSDSEPSDEDADQDDQSDDDATLEQSPVDAEEKVWKKRYDDARRHMNKLTAKVKTLEEQVESASESDQSPLPTNTAEVKAWVEKYPEVYEVIKSAVISSSDNKEVKKQLSELKAQQTQIAYDRAYTEILKVHPDFDELKNNQTFLDWLESQSKMIQDTLYQNTSDHATAIRSIDLYKYDLAKAKKPKSSARDAAKAVTKSNKTQELDTGEEKVWTNAEIEAMSIQDYEKNEAAIKEAMAKGKIVK